MPSIAQSGAPLHVSRDQVFANDATAPPLQTQRNSSVFATADPWETASGPPLSDGSGANGNSLPQGTDGARGRW